MLPGVTYDITFIRRRPGQTLHQTLEERNAKFEEDEEPIPMKLTAGQRSAWERIVERVATEVGPATSEEYLYCLTLRREGPAGCLQLDYDGESADIAIPYRYAGQAALPILTEAYCVARIVEEVSGLEGYDGQTDQPTAVGDIETAAGKLRSVSAWAQDNLT